LVGQGDLGYSRYAVQNLEVVSLSNSAAARRLTHGNGAWAVAWSLDGQRLAYTDYDANQVEQLYVSKSDGAERIQLTHLTDPDLTFDSLKWSPDGRRIAFRTRPRIVSSFSSSLGSVAVTATAPPVYMQAIHGANIFWWPDAEMLMALALPESTGDDSTQEALFGFEADTGRVLNQRPRTDIPNQEMTFPEPLLPEQIGFFSGLDFYIYNLSTESFERQAEGVVLNIFSWSPAPPAFAGEAECSK
jgi:dipeptidyl aminopeptidase/acylaminoacyl peptidase